MHHFQRTGDLSSVTRSPAQLFDRMNKLPLDRNCCTTRGIEIHEKAAHWHQPWLHALQHSGRYYALSPAGSREASPLLSERAPACGVVGDAHEAPGGVPGAET